jgi:hypothetical protein
MNRLRDIVEREGGLRGDPLFRRGVELLQETPPAVVLPETRARVWRAIRRATKPASRGLRTLALKFAVVGAVVLVAGTAGAVIAHRWIAPHINKTPGEMRGAEPPSGSRSLGPRVSPPPHVEAARVEAPVELPGEGPAETPAPKIPARTGSRKAIAPAVTATSVARERTEVLDALVALRRAHDPVRAGTLLARYLSAHPGGALREEALALAIEAADARGDRAVGEQLAHVYQGEFPAGRFLAFARSHTH